MRFENLEIGDVFQIDGAWYEAETIGDRIVIGYALKPMYDTSRGLERVPDPNDLAGDQFLTSAFSDLRFNKNNLTDFERQCDEDLKALL